MTFALILIALALLAFVAYLRLKPRPLAVPYRVLRAEGIQKAKRIKPTAPPHTPIRPSGLDTRLPGTEAAAFQKAFDPASRAVYEERSKVFWNVMSSINAELKAIDPDIYWYELLSPTRRVVPLIYALEAEVQNGGLDQYYFNSSGDGAHLVPEALELIGIKPLAAIMRQANALFPNGPSPYRATRMVQMDARDVDAFSALTDQFDDCPGTELYNGGPMDITGAWILANMSDFFKLEEL